MKTLQEYLEENMGKGIIDHSFRATETGQGDIAITIHPDGKDGDTLDFVVAGNHLWKNPDIG